MSVLNLWYMALCTMYIKEKNDNHYCMLGIILIVTKHLFLLTVETTEHLYFVFVVRTWLILLVNDAIIIINKKYDM